MTAVVIGPEEDSHFNRDRKERRRYEVAKAIYLKLLSENIHSGMDYRGMANEAVTAADEFLLRLYQSETVLPTYQS